MITYETPRLTDHGTVIGLTLTQVNGPSLEAGSTSKFRLDTGAEGIMSDSETLSVNETAD